MSRPLRIECYLIPLYRFWALTSECEYAFSHRMPIRDATVRHSAGIHSAGMNSAETQGHTVQRLRDTQCRGAPPCGHKKSAATPIQNGRHGG